MNATNMPGFTAEASLLKVGPYSRLAAVRVEGGGRTVVPQQSAPLPSWWCQVFPWLCAVCGPCTGGIQHCCEPGGYTCITPWGPCYRQWNCYDRRC